MSCVMPAVSSLGWVITKERESRIIWDAAQMQRNGQGPCWPRMCHHHKPALKLQRFGIYLAVGLLVLLSQYYTP